MLKLIKEIADAHPLAVGIAAVMFALALVGQIQGAPL